MQPIEITERSSPAITAPASSPAPADAGQGVDTQHVQSILSSSSRERSGMSSLSSTHLKPCGAVGACDVAAFGNLNRASDIPSLTPAFIAEYSTQYISSSPSTPPTSGSIIPSPISIPTTTPLFVETVDLKDSLQIDAHSAAADLMVIADVTA